MTAEQVAMASLVVLAATFAAIVWYSIETRWLRQEVARQTQLQIRPFITVIYDSNTLCFSLVNIGAGVAREATIREVLLGEPSVTEVRTTVRWDPVDVLASNARTDTVSHFWLQAPDEPPYEYASSGSFAAGHMANFGKSGKKTYMVTVDYRDIAGQAYVATFEVAQGIVRLISDVRA